MNKLYNISCLIFFMCFISGCGIKFDYNVKVEKFETYIERYDIKQTKSINIIIPKYNEIMEVENLNIVASTGLRIKVDLSKGYDIIKELLAEEIIIDSNSNKSINLTINKIQYEAWGFGHVAGIYLYFTVETSDGFKKSFKVQDQSGYSIDRAISGSFSRCVEKILSDNDIKKFINTKEIIGNTN